MTTTHHVRTENGTPTLITTRAALDEINAGMMDKTVKRTIRQMSAARGEADIEYRDGRKVSIRRATPEQIAQHTAPKRPADVSARALAEEIGVSYDDVHDAASDLASEWFPEHGHRAVFRTIPGNDFGLSAAADDEIRKRVKPETDAHGRRIISVKGKRYIVANRISPAKVTEHSNGTTHRWPGGVDYWSERNGDTFGPVCTALGNSKPGTVGAAIWATVAALPTT
jgi:hypothetical protein